MGAASSRPDISPWIDSQSAESAILRTVLYSDVFHYPLCPDEIHHYLIGQPSTLAEVQQALHSSAWLAQHLRPVQGHYVLSGREDLVQRRKERHAASTGLWKAARQYGAILAHVPWVRMVAVTGALAMDNSTAGDDIDYLLVTAAGRVWLARAASIAVVRIGRRAGVGLCPNYVLAETALAEKRRDLFTAHELAQMRPLAGHAVYWAMRAANRWALSYLPNATAPLRPQPELKLRTGPRLFRGAVERGLHNRLVDRIEEWERWRKLRRFSHQQAQPESSAVLDAERVKGHFQDYGRPALEAYEERVARFLG